AQCRVVMQHAAEGMPQPPHRLVAPLQVVDEFVHQVFPIVVHREARIMAVLLQVLDAEVRRQGGEQLAVGGRRKTVGMGEEDGVRHGVRLVGECRRFSSSPASAAMTVTASDDGAIAKYQVPAGSWGCDGYRYAPPILPMPAARDAWEVREQSSLLRSLPWRLGAEGHDGHGQAGDAARLAVLIRQANVPHVGATPQVHGPGD